MQDDTAPYDGLDDALEDVAGAAGTDLAMPVAGDVQSIAESMKAARRKALQAREPLELEVPGFKGMLVGRYSVVDWSVLKAITQRVEKAKDDLRELKGHAAVIGVACQELFAVVPKDTTDAVRSEQTGKWLLPMSRVVGQDGPVKYDAALAEFYGFTGESTTAWVLNAIAPITEKGERENAFMVTVHHNEIMAWIGEENEDADEDYLGESRAAGA